VIVTLVAAAHVAPALAVDVTRFLWAIQQIEGHSWSDPGGAYAIQRGTWRQHTRMPWALASDKQHADYVGRLHLAWLGRSLARDGWPVNAYTLGGAWRWGLEGFKERAAVGRVEYGERVWNLCHAK
jgi:hypothetical protein